MDAYFKNRRVWITGASSGLGEALARALAAEGASLILSARNQPALERVAAQCREAGSREVIVHALDLADTNAIGASAAKLLEQVGKVDVLINNGGISQRDYALQTSLEVDEKLMRVNYLGTVALTKAVLPHMLLHELGHIVTISSVVGKFGSPLRSSYSASKHALHGFFDSLRAELGDSPVRITLICPGYIRTDISKNALTGDGTPQGTMDQATDKGMAPEVFARKALKAIKDGREEALIGGGKELLAVWMKRFFPGILSSILRKAKVT